MDNEGARQHFGAVAKLDPNQLLLTAEQHFTAARFPAALAILTDITARFGPVAPVLHLTALARRGIGELDGAKLAFDAALRIAPGDRQIRNNYGNLLSAMGDHHGALAQYDALTTQPPVSADVHVNRAIVLQRLGRPKEGLAALDMLDGPAQATARIQSIRGSLATDMADWDPAGRAFDAALATEPDRATALAGRARVALERAEPDTADRFRKALLQRPEDDDLKLGLALAIEADGDASAVAMLQAIVQRRPTWVDGHEQLARMLSEAGRPEDITRSYKHALAAVADDPALHRSYWQTLIRARQFADVIDAMGRAPASIADTADARLIHAICASEAGDIGLADKLFDIVDDNVETRLARGRHALRTGHPAVAASLLESVVRNDPQNVTGWAHLSLAWRLTNDPRNAWLSLQQNLWATQDLRLSSDDIGELAILLRSLHRTHAHPIGQSLRGGTQTRGRLFARRDPLLVHLHELLVEAIGRHVAGLPPHDPTHPLLRHRHSPLAITGSWSVRLSHSGFHVSHIHPMGVFSSAFYVGLPDSVSTSTTEEGWLELGRPPVELGLDLSPLVTIEPKPGRLALFPSYLFHGTRPFPAGERLSVAFDTGVTD